MNQESTSSLSTSSRDRRLSRYCAAGAGVAAMVGAATSADASIVFINFNNQVVVDTNLADTSFALFPFDLDGDGRADFNLGQRVSGGTGGAIITRPSAAPNLGVIAQTANGYNYASLLAAGANIGGTVTNFIALTGTLFANRASLWSVGSPGEQWGPGQTTGFLGIRFTLGTGQVVNGFIQLTISDGTGATPHSITLIGAGYETSGGPIVAQNQPAVPEPSTTLGLVALGAAGLMAHRRRTAAKV